MKLAAFLIVVSSLLAIGQSKRKIGWKKVLHPADGAERLLRNGRHNEPCCYFLFAGDGVPGCIAPLGTQDGDKLYLGDCSQDQGWRSDELGRYHSIQDDDVCMQAGHGGTLRDGSKMRMYQCDPDQVLQRFTFNSLSINPVSHPELCVVHEGVTRDVGTDEIILKECEGIAYERLDWSPDSFNN